MASRVPKKIESSLRREDGIWEQLVELKAVTQETGTLHEAQKKQLQMWGWLAFPHADSFAVAVGLPYMNGKDVVEFYRVEYRVDASTRPPRNLRNLLGGLTRSIHSLLGDHFEVVAKVNGKTIFVKKGGRKKASPFKKTYDRLRKNAKPAAK